MLRPLVLVLALLAALAASPAMAQTMPLDDFVARANRIPLNPTSAIRPDARRLVREFNAAMSALSAEQRALREAGRPRDTCPPEKLQFNPRQTLDHLNAIPAAQRARMTTTDGLRHWMAARWPCPAP